MEPQKDPAENAVVDFIDDENYYQVRRLKEDVEKGTWAIYIFAALSMLGFLFSVLRSIETIDWMFFAINLIIIIMYFCLGAYSNKKPFTSFIGVFCLLGFIFLANLYLNAEVNLKGILLKAAFAVYLSLKLNAAKKVQNYTPSAP